jgi:hypothetical protein
MESFVLHFFTYNRLFRAAVSACLNSRAPCSTPFPNELVHHLGRQVSCISRCCLQPTGTRGWSGDIGNVANDAVDRVGSEIVPRLAGSVISETDTKDVERLLYPLLKVDDRTAGLEALPVLNNRS